jgi:hypothetical protein
MLPKSHQQQSRGFILTGDDGKHQIGVYLPTDATTQDVTVYWRGKFEKSVLLQILKAAEQSLRRTGKFEETVVIYGKDKETLGPVTQDVPGLASLLAGRKFDACRAELAGPRGKMVLWANVKNGVAAPPLELAQGGENIGVSFPPGMFDATARPVVSYAIQHTLPFNAKATQRVLGEVNELVHSAPMPS